MMTGVRWVGMLPGFLLAGMLLVFPVAADTMTEYLNTNLEGGDYLTVAAPVRADCSNACLNDPNCLAATWVHRVGSEPSCWLKNSVPPKTPFPGDMTLVMHSYIREIPAPSGSACWGIAPKVQYDVNPTFGTAPLTIVFSNFSVYPPEMILTNDPGSTNPADGGMSLSGGISYYTYHSPGTYQWTTTLTNPCGLTDTKITTITVLPPPAPPSGSGCWGIAPTAEFTAVPLSGSAPLMVTVTDLATGATECSWQFIGNDPASAAAGPCPFHRSFTYANPGVYILTHRAANACGSLAEKTTTITVHGPTQTKPAGTGTAQPPGITNPEPAGTLPGAGMTPVAPQPLPDADQARSPATGAGGGTTPEKADSSPFTRMNFLLPFLLVLLLVLLAAAGAYYYLKKRRNP